MKLSKLFKIGAVALLATSLCFVGCKADDEEDAFSGDKVDFSNKYVFVSDTDSTDIKKAESLTDTKKGYTAKENKEYFYRAFKQTTTKHYDSTCTITLTPNAVSGVNCNGTTYAANGVAGFVFGLSDKSVKSSDEKTSGTAYTFGVAAVRWNSDKNKAQYYVTWENEAVVKQNNYQTSGDFVDIDGKSVTETVFNTTGKAATFAWSDLSEVSKSGDTVTVAIKVTANDDGAYTVDFLKTADSATPLATVSVDATTTGLSKKTQLKLARYANIYPSEYLTGEYKFSGTNGEAIVFEDDIVEE